MTTKRAKQNISAKTVRGYEYLLLAVITALFGLFTMHPDLMETSNHSYILLDAIFRGEAFDFYRLVQEHHHALYYINDANYNIAIYLLFALWQLPLYLLSLLFSLPMNETLYFIWSKGLPLLAFFGSARMLGSLLLALGCDADDAKLASFAFCANPIAFFFVAAMGQYDVFCLFFLLWSLLFYQRKDLLRFSLLIGIAALGKFFSLFLLFPLLLRAEKRPLPLLKYTALSLMPLLLTSFLFGQGGTSPQLQSMLARPFETTVGNMALFPVLLAALTLSCFLKKDGADASDAVYLPLAVFGGFLLLVDFHPQWVILFVPFWIAAVALQRNKQLYLYLGMLSTVSLSLYMFLMFRGHFEINLFGFGLLRLLGNTDIAVFPFRTIATLIDLQPLAVYLARYLFPAVLVAILLARLPTRDGVSLADGGTFENPAHPKRVIWCVFFAGILFWAVMVGTSLLLSL